MPLTLHLPPPFLILTSGGNCPCHLKVSSCYLCTLLCTRCHKWFLLISLSVCEYACESLSVIKMVLHVHIAQWQKYIAASQLHILHSAYHLWEFKLMCYIREILFIHSIWQLPFQSVSGNDFTVLPAVERGSGFDQCSVAGLWDWVCDLLYGGHLELSRGNGWNAIAGEDQENGVSEKRKFVLHSSSTNHHYPQASRIHFRTFQLH